MKKYLSIGAFTLAAAMISLPAVAGACWGNNCGDNGNDLELKVENTNKARVINEVNSRSNTGDNLANRNGGIGRIETGGAYSDAMAQTEANDNRTVVECSDCIENAEEMKIENYNRASVVNKVDSEANTGKNEANANKGKTITVKKVKSHPCAPATPVRTVKTDGSGIIKTGDATSYATAVTMVNSNVTRIR
jgi:hypothetical protein